MAKSGNKTVTVTQWDSLKFAWSVVSQNIAENTSTVDWSLSLVSGSSGRIDSTASKAWSVTIDGQTFSGNNTVGIGNNSTLKLAGGTVKIKHNANGSKSFNYSFSQTFDITFGGSKIGTISGLGSGDIDPIYGATVPKLSTTSAEMGTEITITTENPNSSVTHDLAYRFGNLDWQTIANGVKGSTKWKIPITLANEIPHKTTGTVTIRCLTKSGNTVIGQNSASLAVSVPASVVPVISSVSITEAAELPEGFDVYVQNVSMLNVSIAAESAYGSPIESYSAILEKKIYTGESWTSDVLRGSGDIDLVVKVTDKRGRTTEKPVTVNVKPYEKPQIYNFTAERCDASGTKDEGGEYVKIHYEYSAKSVAGKNTVLAEVVYKKFSDSGYTTEPIFTSTSTFGYDDTFIDTVTFPTDSAYDFKLIVSDLIGNKAERAFTVESDNVIMDIRADGKGLSFFEFCENEGVGIRRELPGNPEIILEGADLNDLTKPGFYAVPTAEISKTLLNRPSHYDAPASLQVLTETVGSDISIRQIFRSTRPEYNTQQRRDLKIWERSYKSDLLSNKWGPWVCIYAGAGNVIWSGNNKMGEGERIDLSESILKQPNGVVFIFSNAGGNFFFNSFFVHKYNFNLMDSTSYFDQQFIIASEEFVTIGIKRLFIYPTYITGRASNTAIGTSSTTGITYNNSTYSLRCVIGV